MEKNETVNLPGRIAAWIQRYRIVLLSTAGVLVTFLIVVGIIATIQSAKSEKAEEFLLSFEKSYGNWLNAAEAEKAAAATEIEEQFALLDEEYQGTWAHQRGLFLMGDYYYQQESWLDAAESYENLAAGYPRSYLAPVALFNAAASREQEGAREEALELYRRIGTDYGSSPLAPRALFSVARITEETDSTEAITAYTALIERFPSSSWTKLSRSRIIQLQIGG